MYMYINSKFPRLIEACKAIVFAHEDDGFTMPYWIDMESGTWGGGELRVLRLTHDQTNRFDDMSDDERIDYASRYGKRIL